MDSLDQITRIFNEADQITFDDNSRIVLMSDCHRGDGNWPDDFSRNQNLCFVALNHYYKKNFTYIEIGDGDELWENKRFSDIKQAHSHVFWLLSRFYSEGRLHMIFGNHDMVKRDKRFAEENFYDYYNEPERKYYPLFKGIKFHEGLVLKYKPTGHKILLIHGHQVDYLNNRLWKLARFLVRYFWRPLTSIGVNDPTRAAKNYNKKEATEKKLTEWVLREKHMLIAGHTHRPMFPEAGQPNYFNDGSCVHPRCVTAIEISGGDILLVKWNVKTKDDGTLYIAREVLAGPRRLAECFGIREEIRKKEEEQEHDNYMRIFV